MSRSTPPKSDELEISVIGPGRGECLLLHLGNNEWCIVDSCISPGSSEPVAIEYLNSFNNHALQGIKLIVGTHWHDDHIRGLSALLRNAPEAMFFCSAALNTDNFFELVGTSGKERHSGAEEFASILGMIEESQPDPPRLASPKWAVENLPLLSLPNADRPFNVKVTALSPSHGTVRTAFMQISQLVPKAGDIQRRIPERSLNHLSMVLWVEAGDKRALLGADLEDTSHAGEGWTAVLTCHGQRGEAQSAEFFKIPHHGSRNADNETVWDEMLVANPIAVVTPFTAGKMRLPGEGDIRRLAGRTNRLYCTAAGPGRPPGRDNVVERFVREQVVDRRVIEGNPGHVRVRWTIGNQQADPIVETFNGAYRIN